MCPGGKDNLCGHRFDGKFGELPQGYDHKHVYSHFGYNLKVSDMQAAVGCAQLKKLPHFVERRRQNFNKLFNGLKVKRGGAYSSGSLPKFQSQLVWFSADLYRRY